MLERMLYRGAPERLASRWRAVAGHRVAERYSDLAGAPVAVLVHGIGVSGLYMLPLAARLASSHTVYVPDLPGSGRSERLRGRPTLAYLSRLFEEWLDEAGLRSPEVLIGNSFGCQLLLDLAARSPERVDRLVLLGPTVDRRARTFRGQASALALDIVREPAALFALQAADYLRYLAKTGPRGFREMLRDATEERLPRVAATTLVVRGTRDPIAGRAWCKEVVAALPRGELAEIRGAAHAVNYAAPDAVAALVTQFAASVPRKDSRRPTRGEVVSDKREFGAGPGNTIGRDHEDVGGIGSTPGAIPDERAGGEPDGGAGTQGGAPGDLARATGTGESGLGGGEGDAGGGGGAGGDMAPFDDAGGGGAGGDMAPFDDAGRSV